MGRNFENRKQAIFKRGAANNKAFTRATRQVTMAVKAGGGDPETNPTLRRAIQNANAVNMPKDRVTSAIEKALGLNDTDNYEEAIYEGYGPHGVAIIVDTATDNVTRTVANVRNAFKKGNGNLGAEGSVSFMFDRLGIFRLKPEGLDREEMELELIDHGLDEMLDGTGEDGSEQVILRCAFEDFGSLQSALEERKIEPVSSGFEWIPKTTTELSEEQMDEVLKLIARLEDDDDVQTVFHNVE
ncbi:MAG: YebC/PmpR family DNA-binding transcriptional regulator [Nannocystales bacterium]